jgi:hypothetical protein
MTVKTRTGWTLLLAAVALAFSSRVQDGGKIAWKGKDSNADVKALMAQAEKDGKAIMMFFTSEG